MAASSPSASSTTLKNSLPNSEASSSKTRTPSTDDIELKNFEIEEQKQTAEVVVPKPTDRTEFFRKEDKKFDENKVLRALQKLLSKTRVDYFWGILLSIWLLIAIIGIPVSLNSSSAKAISRYLTYMIDQRRCMHHTGLKALGTRIKAERLG